MSDNIDSQECIKGNSKIKEFETPAKTLELLVELQNILTTSSNFKKMMIGYNDQAFKQSQSQYWFEEDEKVLLPILKKLQKEFGLNSIGVIQKAAPGYNNEFIVTKKGENGEYDDSLQELLERRILIIDEKNLDVDAKKKIGIYTETEIANSSFGPVVFPCSINNNSKKDLNEEDITFGYLGIIPTLQQAMEMFNEQDNGVMRLVTMIANQLGLYFGHLNLTRRKALNDRLKKTIEVIDTRLSFLDNPNDPKQILEDLADFITKVFNQQAGAIYTYVRNQDLLEKTSSLNPWIPDLVTTEEIFANEEVLNAIKKTNTLDNRNKEIDIPIRYVFPITSTFSKYSRALIIFESDLNPQLSKDEIEVISYRLKEKIGFHLQAADNFANRIASVFEFEDLIKNISNPSVMQDKMIKVISDHLKVDIISYMEVDPTRKYLILKKGQGHSSSVVPNETKQLIDNSISGLVVKYAKTLYIKDISDIDEIQKNFPDENRETLKKLFKEQHETNYHTKSLLSVPLITGIGSANRKVTGVINVNNKDDLKPFTLGDKRT